MKVKTFDFGNNWAAYSADILNPLRVEEAVLSLRKLLGSQSLEGKSFLDVGCGSGLFSIAASFLGADKVVAFDLNLKSVQVSKENYARFVTKSVHSSTQFIQGDILDLSFMKQLGDFDIVYSWGVLHHTGQMWKAIRNTAGCVKDVGTLVIAIYNRHWSSFFWKVVKIMYNQSPQFVCDILNYLCGGVMFISRWIVTGTNPLNQPRGMDFWYNVIDWLGGYPYEYATPTEIQRFVENLGYKTIKINPPPTQTGCNEYVFLKKVRIYDD
jgi:2-polyprenyl-6-hydroxyphenyl methylase/3-demethylubiquinone-9 3-methyltransferase